MNAKEEADSREAWSEWWPGEELRRRPKVRGSMEEPISDLAKLIAREAFAAGFAAGKEQR